MAYKITWPSEFLVTRATIKWFLACMNVKNYLIVKISYYTSHNGVVSLQYAFVYDKLNHLIERISLDTGRKNNVSHLSVLSYEMKDFLFEKKSFDIDHKRIVSVSNEFSYELSIDLALKISYYTCRICVF